MRERQLNDSYYYGSFCPYEEAEKEMDYYHYASHLEVEIEDFTISKDAEPITVKATCPAHSWKIEYWRAGNQYLNLATFGKEWVKGMIRRAILEEFASIFEDWKKENGYTGLIFGTPEMEFANPIRKEVVYA